MVLSRWFSGFVCLATWLFAAAPAWAQGERDELASDEDAQTIVVTATRVETPADQVGSSVTVITAEEIQRGQYQMVIEALQHVPGVTVRRSGGTPGTQTSIFTRGTNSDHTLVLVDGVKIHDPSGPARAPFLDNLKVDDIERIEVLRGPQSTLYGSEAIGGVINIITKKGDGRPKFTLSAEGGSFGTANGRFSSSGAVGMLNYSLSASRLDTDGISAKSDNSERDGYKNTSVAARMSIEPTDAFGADLVFRYIDSDLEIDLGDDQSISETDGDQFLFRVEPRLSLFDGRWEQKLAYWLHDVERDNDGTGFFLPSHFDGRIYGIEWQHDLHLHDSNTLVLGGDYEAERATFDNPLATIHARTHRFAFFLQDQLRLWDRLFLTGGFRVDDHDDFGTETTYRFTGAFRLKETGTILRGSVGTAFKAPTLSQLFDTTFSSNNPDLKPEESFGWDAGFEQQLCDGRIGLTATYFYNDIDELIAFQGGGLVNLNKVVTEGAEVSITLKPIDSLTLTGNYTYTRAKQRDDPPNQRLLRRPRNEVSVDASFNLLDERANFTVRMLYVGERRDFGASGIEIADDYVVVDLLGSFRIGDHLEVFGRVENLFDENYEDVLGFKTPGTAGYGGLRIRF